jgi:hypothetical protein
MSDLNLMIEYYKICERECVIFMIAVDQRHQTHQRRNQRTAVGSRGHPQKLKITRMPLVFFFIKLQMYII